MIVLVWNLVLALIWAAATARFSLSNLVVGYVLGYLTLWLLRPALDPTGYFRKLPQAAGFVAFFLLAMIRANFRMAYDVVTPAHHMRSGIVAVPLDAKTDFEIMLLTSLITLTPGTLSLDLSDDRQLLFVHAMFVGDAAAVRREIKQGLETRLLELLR